MPLRSVQHADLSPGGGRPLVVAELDEEVEEQ
jgi:hypothetical protein